MTTRHTMPKLGVPYAPRRIDMGTGQVWARCPACGVEIELRERKDFESMTGREYAEHFASAAEAERTE